MRLWALPIALPLVACGPVVDLEDDPDGTTSTSSATTGPDSRGPTTSRTTTGTPDDPRGEAEATGDPDSTGSTSSTVPGGSTTGADLIADPDQVYADLRCTNFDEVPGPHLWIEAYPSAETGGSCAPPPDVDGDLLLIYIQQWDGASGTFEFGESSPHRASIGLDDSNWPVGLVHLEVDEPYGLVRAEVDLSTQSAAVTGALDFSLCPPKVADPPCP